MLKFKNHWVSGYMGILWSQMDPVQIPAPLLKNGALGYTDYLKFLLKWYIPHNVIVCIKIENTQKDPSSD